jgi:methylated-DNA-[protein]-cysteine S-methyltransferase
MKTPVFEAQSRITTPLGPLTLAATAKGLGLVWFDGQAHRTDTVNAPFNVTHPHLVQAAQEFAEYFARQRQIFNVPLDPQGTAFQLAVWQLLLKLPLGQLSTYGALARELGQPSASRAVGAAVGRNPIGIIVPCHRIVGRDGSLTGYAGGLHRKEALLQLEGALWV